MHVCALRVARVDVGRVVGDADLATELLVTLELLQGARVQRI